MPVLRSTPQRISRTALLAAAMLAALTLLATPNAGADDPKNNDQMGIEDGGVAGNYSFGAAECGNDVDKADPVGVLFRGRRAGWTNVQGYLKTENHTDWDHTENYGAQGLNVRVGSGEYACYLTHAANAEQSGKWANSRHHVRLWPIPAPGGGPDELKTVGTPHHEDFIPHDPTGVSDHCVGAVAVTVNGVTISGNHAVDEGGVKQGKDSGFDQSRHKLREKFDPKHDTESEYWGNTNEYEQCDEDWAGSDGWGVIIWLRRGLRADTSQASSIQATGSTLNGHLATEEPTTEYWFAYGLNSAQGISGYPYKTSVKSISGSAELDASQAISGLSPNTQYFVRMFARNQDGEVEEGNEVKFKTCGWGAFEEAAPGPRAITACDGTRHVFYRTPSGGLGHNWYVLGGSGWGSEVLPGSVASEPHPVLNKNNGLGVFYRTPSGGLGHTWWGANSWASEVLPGSLASEPHPVVNSKGGVGVFYRTPSGGLGHTWLGATTWASEVLPGSVVSEPHPAIRSGDRIGVFYRTPSGGLGHTWLGATTWASEVLPGSLSSEPHPLVNHVADGIGVFYRTPSGGLGHTWLGSSSWSSEALPGSLASEPHPVIRNSGGIGVFYRTPSGGLGHSWLGSTTWASEVIPGSLASEPHPLVNHMNDGIGVFYRTPSGALGHTWLGATNWASEVLPGSLSSEPHPLMNNSFGGPGVFYRTPSGGLGHTWLGSTTWTSEMLPGSVAARPPTVSTGGANAAGTSGAKLEGTVNPGGSPTSYYFEYGTTTSYGSKQPVSSKGIGYGFSSTAVSETLSGLTPNTLYHYRLVATSPEGTTNGIDKTFVTTPPTAAQLSAMLVTEPFNGSTESLANFGSKWSTIGWAAGSTPKGANTTSGWGPVDPFPTMNGAYYNSSLTDTGTGVAAVATMATNPGNPERNFSLWLDIQTPAGTRSGYELRFSNTATNTYTVRLSKWVGGVETTLASKSSYSFVNGNTLAIVDKGGTVSVWTDTGSGFGQLLSASDSTFSSGYAGMHGAGYVTRLNKFKAGKL